MSRHRGDPRRSGDGIRGPRPVAIADGAVYVAGPAAIAPAAIIRDGLRYRADGDRLTVTVAATAEPIQTIAFDAPIGAFAVGEAYACVATDGGLHGIRLADGDRLWDQATDGLALPFSVNDGLLYRLTAAGLSVHDAATGDRLDTVDPRDRDALSMEPTAVVCEDGPFRLLSIESAGRPTPSKRQRSAGPTEPDATGETTLGTPATPTDGPDRDSTVEPADGGPTGADRVDKLIDTLAADDADTRRAAAEELATIAAEQPELARDASAALERCRLDADVAVSRAAARALDHLDHS